VDYVGVPCAPIPACALASLGISYAAVWTSGNLGLAEASMLDAVFLVSTVGFFLLSLAYVRGCDRL